MNNASVIILNGTSSAGKTSIALALQGLLDDVYFIYSRDVFQSMFPGHIWVNNELMKKIGPRMFRGFHASIAAFAKAGNHLIVDHVLNRPEWIYECAEALSDVDAVLVGVRCPIDVAEATGRSDL